MRRVLGNHSLGRQALGCVWILSFAILRTTAEQVDFAFDAFDPIDSSSSVSYPSCVRKGDLTNVSLIAHSYASIG